MSRYLIKLKPVEPYFFGDENAFKPGDKNTSYYITSLPLPPANSIIGMLRYTLLEQSGLLNTDGKYEDIKKVTELIGERSYSPGGSNSFGVITSISPLVIMDKEDTIYIPTPLNHKTSESKYTPLKMRENTIKTSHGDIRLPDSKQFNAKETVGSSSFMNINNGEINKKTEIISTGNDTRVGIDKHKKDEAFFKKAYCRLNEDYSFAFTAEIKFALQDTICYMGRERSPFIMTVSESNRDINNEVSEKLKAIVIAKSGQPADAAAAAGSQQKTDEAAKKENTFSYALSDIIINKKLEYNGYAMVRTAKTRILESEYKNGRIEIKRGSSLYSVIKAGSVFTNKPAVGDQKFGFNNIIELGGKNK